MDDYVDRAIKICEVFFHVHEKKRIFFVLTGVRRAYLRSVHGSNDSKARRGDTLVDPEAMPQLLKAFPLLKDLRGDWEMDRKLHELAAAGPERVLTRV